MSSQKSHKFQAPKVQPVTEEFFEPEEKTGRGMGIFAVIAIVTIVGIAVWIILANNQES